MATGLYSASALSLTGPCRTSLDPPLAPLAL